ncbi:MAG: hypothetical protein ACI4DP_00845 [Candidatus Ornithomonoglobus sp.]
MKTKKTHEFPEIRITKFDAKDIVTVSGEPDPTAHEQAAAALTTLGVADANKITLTF